MKVTDLDLNFFGIVFTSSGITCVFVLFVLF